MLANFFCFVCCLLCFVFPTGLPYLLLKKAFKDAYVLHDEAAHDPIVKVEQEEKLARIIAQTRNGSVPRSMSLARNNTISFPQKKQLLLPDTRQELDDTWGRFFKYQPFWKIRNYFGEKIGLYFAWSGMLITSLWIPTIFGIIVFFYGLEVR